ncbi:glycosyltransferase family 47 protein, partial [bacterium]|nr:glycosyltransferase family 47 protein [bacterium]
MLNELPGVYVAGERASRSETDVIDTLFDYYETATHYNQRSGPFQTFAKVDEKLVLCEIQRAIKAALGPIPSHTRLLGFKTLHAASSSKRLEQLRSVFPCARFVHNHRRDVHAEFHSPRSFFLKNGVDEEGLQRRTDLLASPRYDHFDLPLESFGVPLFNDLRRFAGDENCTYVRVKHSNYHNFRSDPIPVSVCNESKSKIRGPWLNSGANNTQSKLQGSVRQVGEINKKMMFNQYGLEEYAFAQQSRMPTSWRLVSSPLRQGSRCFAAKYRACAGSCMWKDNKCERWRHDKNDACEVDECCMDCWLMVQNINRRTLDNYWDNLEDECRSNAPSRHLVMFLTFVCGTTGARRAMRPLRDKVCLQNHLTIFSYEPVSDHVRVAPSTMLRQNAFITVPYTTVGKVRPVSTSLRPWRYMGSFDVARGNRLKIRTDLAAYLSRPGHHHSGTKTCGGRSSVNENDDCTTATADFCLEPPGDTPTRSHFYWAISQGCLPVVF